MRLASCSRSQHVSYAYSIDRYSLCSKVLGKTKRKISFVDDEAHGDDDTNEAPFIIDAAGPSDNEFIDDRAEDELSEYDWNM